ncbi:MAG: hypothetical protein ACOCSD_04725 [Halolamina sp.]
MHPDDANSWIELDGVWSVEQTGEPMGWRRSSAARRSDSANTVTRNWS